MLQIVRAAATRAAAYPAVISPGKRRIPMNIGNATLTTTIVHKTRSIGRENSVIRLGKTTVTNAATSTNATCAIQWVPCVWEAAPRALGGVELDIQTSFNCR